MNTVELIEEYTNAKLKDGIKFQCNKVKKLKDHGNKNQQFVRLDFQWEKEGVVYTFSRRANWLHIPQVLDGYIEEVNKMAS